jgi:hypothetical protein
MPKRFVNGRAKISKLAREPSALSEPLIGKISAPHCNLSPSTRFADDAHHVVTVWLVCDTGDPAVGASRADDLSLLTNVDSGFRRGDLVARTSFDLYERQCEWLGGFIVCDDVNLACYLATSGAIADGRDEIGCDYPIAFPLETLCGQPLAVSAQSQMGSASFVLTKFPEKI